MKRKLPVQLIVALVIVVIGGGFLAAEYFTVKWYPYYRGKSAEKKLALLPYQNNKLGVTMQVAKAIYGKVDEFPGGVRIYRTHYFSDGPSLTLTSQANPDHSGEFSPQLMAQWETTGTYQNIPDYQFNQEKIQGRDAALIWQEQGKKMLVTAHIISPDHIIEANCLSGSSDQDVDVKACEATLRSINVAGPKSQPSGGVLELKTVLPHR